MSRIVLRGLRMLVLVPLALSRENISVVVPVLSVVGETVPSAFFFALCFLAWETPILKTLKRRNHIDCSLVVFGCIGSGR